MHKRQRFANRANKAFNLMCIAFFAVCICVSWGRAISRDRQAHSVPDRYSTYTVREGDTLWSIAARHERGGMDIRAYIDRLAADNHIHVLCAGDVLHIAEWEENAG